LAKFSISLAGSSDIKSLGSMFDEYRQFYDQKSDIKLAVDFISNRIEQGESIIHVARNDFDEAIGFCQLYPSFCSVEAIRIYVLYDLFVRPKHRRRGVGRALLLQAEAHAKLNKVGRMDLSTAKTNAPAQALYESLGWVRDEVFLTYSLHPDG